MKKCIICNQEKELEDFYKHPEMVDGHLNKCKECCKNQQKQREKQLREDPDWVEKEKERGREKYQRLNYKEKHKPSYKKKKVYIDKYNSKFPEKRKAHQSACRIPRKDGYELHHWSYLEENWKDVIEISVSDHNIIHRHMIYDSEYKCYRDSSNELLDTKQKHLEYIKKYINI